MKTILSIGLNHRLAPVEVRERLAFGPERTPGALRELCARMQAAFPQSGQACEAVLLSTCNRTEIYVCAPDARQAGEIIRAFLADYARQSSAGGKTGTDLSGALCQEDSPLLYVYRGSGAVRHLLSVAAGLDSLVTGENEILGQVKQAFEIAHTTGTSGPLLSALFRYAVQAGKRVRNETDIGQARLSVATMVVEMAQERLGHLAQHTALLIGAGKISAMTARALVSAGLRCVLVANRTFARAQKMAHNLGGEQVARAVRFDALAESLLEADIVICSTGAPHIVLHLEAVQTAMAARPERPLLVADLAVPRDADPQIGDLPGVCLVDIDDLEELVQSHHPLAVAVRQAAGRIVDEETQAFLAWLKERDRVPLIRALRARAETICEEQVDDTLRRMGEVTPEQARAVHAMGKAIIARLLHDPITNLKAPPDGYSPEEYARLVENLFGLS